jgi:AcrR family transcriptional regulator
MSPQHSNRSRLIDGTLRCLEKLPPERVTARAIATESGANLASIAYHFGSKDELVTQAVIEGLDRWLAEVDSAVTDLGAEDPRERYRMATEAIEATRERHRGLAVTFLVALARAQHDPAVRRLLTEGFRRARSQVATVLGLGDDQAGEDAGGLVLALFDGLLFQGLLDPELAIEGKRMNEAQARLAGVLPG